jgi:DNA-binding IclR family transcriptional regulator
MPNSQELERTPPLSDDRAASPGADRALLMLEIISKAGEKGLTASEIARLLELPHNSTCRIADTLQARGFVERRGEERRYYVTGKLLDLARPRVGDKSFTVAAFEPLCELRDLTGETAQLCVRSQNKCVVIEQAGSRQPVKVLGEIGFRVPLYSCAPGKAMLAAMPASELDAFFEAVTLKQYTPTTRATRKALMADLLEARKSGYALDRSEGMEGIHCVGAAIVDANGYPVGGITVIGPAFRLREEHFEKIGKHCVAIAAEIRRRVLA